MAVSPGRGHWLITLNSSVAGVDVAVCQEVPQSRDKRGFEAQSSLSHLGDSAFLNLYLLICQMRWTLPPLYLGMLGKVKYCKCTCVS